MSIPKTTKINIGKYKGKTVAYIISKDKKYYNWMLENWSSFNKNNINSVLPKDKKVFVEPVKPEPWFLTWQEEDLIDNILQNELSDLYWEDQVKNKLNNNEIK